MKILVLNSGSSSIKYKLIDMEGEILLADGVIERIGEDLALINHRRYESGLPESNNNLEQNITDHVQGMEEVVALLTADDTGVIDDLGEIDVIGHRVVHGGELFRESTLIDDSVIANIKACIPLAPIHNPGCLAGIQTAMSLFQETRQVAVFDTAFHQTIPPKAFVYALPYSFYEDLGIRRYGFHGTSHSYVTAEAACFMGKPITETSLISLHLGNGSSITAVANGCSVDTSMGMTPLAGVIMGTRCGDIDPAIVEFIADKKDLSLNKVMQILYKESGLKGICGFNDMRDIHRSSADGDALSRLALEMLVYRCKQYIGSYLAVLGHVDALVFTAGIGENDALVRLEVCTGLENLGIILDEELNSDWSGITGIISAQDSPVQVIVISTDEELEIARQTKITIDLDEDS